MRSLTTAALSLFVVCAVALAQGKEPPGSRPCRDQLLALRQELRPLPPDSAPAQRARRLISDALTLLAPPRASLLPEFQRRLQIWLEENPGLIPSALRARIASQVDGLAVCSAWAAVARGEPPQRVSITVAGPIGNPNAPRQNLPPAAGATIFLDRIAVAQTNQRGLAEFDYPPGTYQLDVVQRPGNAGQATLRWAAGPVRRHVVLDSGKEPAADSHATIAGLQGGILPAPLAGLRIAFRADLLPPGVRLESMGPGGVVGETVLLKSLSSVRGVSRQPELLLDLTEDFEIRDGVIELKDPARLLAFLTQAQGEVEFDILAGDTEGWSHQDTLRCTYGTVLVDPPTDPAQRPATPWDLKLRYHDSGAIRYVTCNETGCNLKTLPPGRVTVTLLTRKSNEPLGELTLRDRLSLPTLLTQPRGRPEWPQP